MKQIGSLLLILFITVTAMSQTNGFETDLGYKNFIKYYKNNSGLCFLEHILFLQPYSGGKYGPTKIYSAYGKKKFACGLGK